MGLFQDLEEQRELATNRHIELEEMSGKYKSSLKEVERLKMELSTLPGVVTSTFVSPFDNPSVILLMTLSKLWFQGLAVVTSLTEREVFKRGSIKPRDLPS